MLFLIRAYLNVLNQRSAHRILRNIRTGLILPKEFLQTALCCEIAQDTGGQNWHVGTWWWKGFVDNKPWCVSL